MLARRNPTAPRNLVPFGPVSSPFAEFDRLFDVLGTTRAAQPTQAVAPFTLWRTADAFVAAFDLPGLIADDIHIDAEAETLTIRGERTTSFASAPEGTSDDGPTVLHDERGAGSFERTLRLPAEIDPERVEASLDNGVLTITLPLAERVVARRVQINAGRPALAHETTQNDNS